MIEPGTRLKILVDKPQSAQLFEGDVIEVIDVVSGFEGIIVVNDRKGGSYPSWWLSTDHEGTDWEVVA